MEELFIDPCPNFIDNTRFKINKDSSGHIFTGVGLAEESIKSIMASTIRGATARKYGKPFRSNRKSTKSSKSQIKIFVSSNKKIVQFLTAHQIHPYK